MKKTTTLILALAGFSSSSISQSSRQIVSEVDSTKADVTQYSAAALQAHENEENSNPEDFGFEKVVIDGREFWIKQTEKIRIVYTPRNQ